MLSEAASWFRRGGQHRACIGREQFAECLPAKARTHPKFDAGACFDTAVAHLAQLSGGRSRSCFYLGDVLLYTDGGRICARSRPRFLPTFLWRVGLFCSGWRLHSTLFPMDAARILRKMVVRPTEAQARRSMLILALHHRVGREDLTQLEVTRDNLAALVDERTRTAPGFSPEACFAGLAEGMDGAEQPIKCSGIVEDWPDAETFCYVSVHAYREGDRIIVKRLRREVRPAAPAQEDPLIVISEVAGWLGRSGRPSARIARESIADCISPRLQAHSRFDAGACFDVARAWLARIPHGPLDGGAIGMGVDAEVLISTDGRHIRARKRPRYLPEILWRAYMAAVRRRVPPDIAIHL